MRPAAHLRNSPFVDSRYLKNLQAATSLLTRHFYLAPYPTLYLWCIVQAPSTRYRLSQCWASNMPAHQGQFKAGKFMGQFKAGNLWASLGRQNYGPINGQQSSTLSHFGQQIWGCYACDYKWSWAITGQPKSKDTMMGSCWAEPDNHASHGNWQSLSWANQTSKHKHQYYCWVTSTKPAR